MSLLGKPCDHPGTGVERPVLAFAGPPGKHQAAYRRLRRALGRKGAQSSSYLVSVARDLKFTLPTSGAELVAKFVTLSEGSQRLLLAAMKMGVEQQGNQQVGDLLTWLREDERTQETVARLESTPYVKLPKSKARRGQ